LVVDTPRHWEPSKTTNLLSFFNIILIMNIFVAKLNYDTTAETLREVFEQYGEVSSVKVIMDRETGQSRGFGFVEMPDDTEGYTAIGELNGTELEGREIVVKKAVPPEDRNRGGGGGRFNRGGGGGGRFNRGGGGGRFNRGGGGDRFNRGGGGDRFNRGDRYDRGGGGYDKREDNNDRW
jgi:RNA recognition motif-containing protein